MSYHLSSVSPGRVILTRDRWPKSMTRVVLVAALLLSTFALVAIACGASFGWVLLGSSIGVAGVCWSASRSDLRPVWLVFNDQIGGLEFFDGRNVGTPDAVVPYREFLRFRLGRHGDRKRRIQGPFYTLDLDLRCGATWSLVHSDDPTKAQSLLHALQTHCGALSGPAEDSAPVDAADKSAPFEVRRSSETTQISYVKQTPFAQLVALWSLTLALLLILHGVHDRFSSTMTYVWLAYTGAIGLLALFRTLDSLGKRVHLTITPVSIQFRETGGLKRHAFDVASLDVFAVAFRFQPRWDTKSLSLLTQDEHAQLQTLEQGSEGLPFSAVAGSFGQVIGTGALAMSARWQLASLIREEFFRLGGRALQ
ncbi:MAG: hypothetical protein R3B07_15675 [Polyangiaceae bacterium]